MKRILIIEDEVLIRNSTSALLRVEGFEVLVAENGQAGLQLAREHLPDLILCDITMPQMDGYEVLKALRQEKETTNLPFIFLTGKADMSDLRQGMNLGADDYLTKPFTRQELLQAITTRLAKYASTAERYNGELQEVKEQLAYLMNHDPVTGLPTRQLLQQRFNQALQQIKTDDQTVPVLSINLDRFRRVAESLGEGASDRLLKGVAERLAECVNGNGIVARVRADQFVVVWTAPACEQVALAMSERILVALGKPFVVDSFELFVTASVGIALFPLHSKSLDTLIKQANTAVVQIKTRGGNGYQLYTPEIKAPSADHLKMETDLRHALDREEFCVYYQPQVNLKTGKIVGAEALVRWQHPQRGLVSPAQFIPLAEETGLIVPMGEWVLKKACRQVNEWSNGSLRIAVNLSARQMGQSDLSNQIATILGETQFDPAQLELELTETALAREADVTRSVLNNLRAMGVSVAVDDFGTGYSTLTYLKQFSFDTLKIDQSFVRNLATSAENAAITLATIRLAHQLNLKVLAEGVETQEELSFLQQHECDEFQGYLFSRPLPAADFEQLLKTNYSLPVKK